MGTTCVKFESNFDRPSQAVQAVERPLSSHHAINIDSSAYKMAQPFTGSNETIKALNMELNVLKAAGNDVDNLSRLVASLSLDTSFSALGMGMQGAITCGLQFPMYRLGNACIVEGTAEIFLEADAGSGIFIFDIDPLSHQRKQISLNPLHAERFGMHSEEFLARAASYQLPQPFIEMDCLVLLFYRTIARQFPSVPTSVFYSRIYVKTNRGRPYAILFRCHRTMVVDRQGRLVQVMSSYSF